MDSGHVRGRHADRWSVRSGLGRRFNPTETVTAILYYSALILMAYATWSKGWWWTDTTSRRRDFVGFIAVIAFAWLLSLLVVMV